MVKGCNIWIKHTRMVSFIRIVQNCVFDAFALFFPYFENLKIRGEEYFGRLFVILCQVR